jgi:hypothetical protein
MRMNSTIKTNIKVINNLENFDIIIHPPIFYFMSGGQAKSYLIKNIVLYGGF